MNNVLINISDIRLEKDYKKLAIICNFICKNYEKIQHELNQIRDILKNAEICRRTYSENSIIKEYIKEINPTILSTILKKLEDVKEGASIEFTQSIDFVDIRNFILSHNDNKNEKFTIFIWKCQKILQYINYGIDRIKNTDNIKKQISILMGMIAYY